MKKELLVIIIFMCVVRAYSQDIIILRNGDEIMAKIAKVSNVEIEYKKWKNQDGPIYTINKDDVFLIKYSNGEKDIFTNDTQQQSPTQQTNVSTPTFVKKSPAENNKQLIDRYKTPVHFAKTAENKDAHYFFPIMTMSDSSLVSTSDLELKIIPTLVWDENVYGNYFLRYSIELQNKTDKIVYIDLANSFRVFCDGTSESYFNTEETTVNHGSSSGAGFNLGGLTNAIGIGGIVGTLAGATTVGGSNQHSVSTTYTNQRFLAIPPHSKKDLTEFKQVHIKKKEYKTISDLEIYAFNLNSLRGVLKKNGYISYTEDESPYTAKYIITYSTNQDFHEYSVLDAKLYARYVYGAYWDTYCDTKQKKAIKRVQKYISNFWEDSGIIVGRCSYIPKKK